MLYEKKNGIKWEKSVLSKLISFLEKCPVLLDLKTMTKNDQQGVELTHKISGIKYFFPFDYSQPEKDFIHSIREHLVPRHYPRLIEPITEPVELSPEELAKRVEEGANPNTLQSIDLKEIGTKLWLMSKTIVWRDIVILELEKLVLNGEEKPFEKQTVRYKYNGSLAIYLKKYRSGGFSSLEEASKDFFGKSIYINDIQ